MKKQILITNDDGYESSGLKALVEALKDEADITVVAPSSEKSACGHSLSLTKPLEFIKIKQNFYKLHDATPSDCVYLALFELYKNKKPDLVISGINIGANLGEDITYSGTASAAMEAVLHGVPAIAISQAYNKNANNLNFDLASQVIKDLVKKVFSTNYPLQNRRFLNVNIPFSSEFKGYKVTKVGKRIYANEAQKYTNPRNKEFFWIGLPSYEWKKNTSNNCDISAINEGFVTITPIHLDMTCYEELSEVEQWIK